MTINDLLGSVVRYVGLAVALQGCNTTINNYGNDGGNDENGSSLQPFYEGMCDDYLEYVKASDIAKEHARKDYYTPCLENCTAETYQSVNRVACGIIYCAARDISNTDIAGECWTPTGVECLAQFGVTRKPCDGE